MLLLPNRDDSGSFSRDTIKTFFEVFFLHVTNHYDEQSDLHYIYLFIFDLSFVVILRLLDLVPVANSVPEVRSRASIKNAFLLLLPHLPRPQEIKIKEIYWWTKTQMTSHKTFITRKRREI